jgi:hypothetical protein
MPERRSAHSSVETTSASRIITPPIVGVPFFSIRWRSGPSSRIGWPPRWKDRSQRMMVLPKIRQISSAVMAAAPARKVW